MKNHNVCISNLLPVYTLLAGHPMKFCVYPAFMSIVTKRVFKYRQTQPIYVYVYALLWQHVWKSLQVINMKLITLLQMVLIAEFSF
jgi:hypothetical protein